LVIGLATGKWDSTQIPLIPSPEWARGLIIDEYNGGWWTDTHGWSKWFGANGVMALVGAVGPKMTVSVGAGGPPSGCHFVFKIGDKWYHAANPYGQQTMSIVKNIPLKGKPWFTTQLPILFPKAAAPAQGTPVLSCVTSTISAWVRGGGPIFIVAPFAHLFNTKPDPDNP